MRVQRMDEKHCTAAAVHLVDPSCVAQQGDLRTRSAKAFNAMACAGDEQQALGISGPQSCHVHGQFFAIVPTQRVDVRFNLEPEFPRGVDKPAARLGVGLRKVARCVQVNRFRRVGQAWGCANQASASRTQQVAPRGIRSSLKS